MLNKTYGILTAERFIEELTTIRTQIDGLYSLFAVVNGRQVFVKGKGINLEEVMVGGVHRTIQYRATVDGLNYYINTALV